MSLMGFEHVFRDAVEQDIASGCRSMVIPPHVLGLLKIIAYLDHPALREKDLVDISALLDLYEVDGTRRFHADIYSEGLNFDDAGAFLLGRDIGALCGPEEATVVEAFLSKVSNENDPAFAAFRRTRIQDDTALETLERQLAAFGEGFREPKSG